MKSSPLVLMTVVAAAILLAAPTAAARKRVPNPNHPDGLYPDMQGYDGETTKCTSDAQCVPAGCCGGDVCALSQSGKPLADCSRVRCFAPPTTARCVCSSDGRCGSVLLARQSDSVAETFPPKRVEEEVEVEEEEEEEVGILAPEEPDEAVLVDPVDDRFSVCTSDADCVPATCCSPSTCTTASSPNAPDCSAVACLAFCKPGSMDCGQGSCGCDKKTRRCRAYFTEAEGGAN